MRIFLIPLLLTASWAAAAPSGLTAIISGLEAEDRFAAQCNYQVLFPNASEPVEYTVDILSSSSAPGDTLSPADYLLEWTPQHTGTPSRGFSAYFGGHHFRYRDRRLQEYHAETSPQSFAPGQRAENGVQQRVQFYDLLPQSIAATLAKMETDSNYTYSIAESTRGGRRLLSVSGTERRNGYDAVCFKYTFNPENMKPLEIRLQNNPGQISEQEVTVRYSYPPVPVPFPEIDLEYLIRRHPTEFELYRTDTYTLDNLPGRPMPRLGAKNLAGERVVIDHSSTLARPTAVVILDSGAGDPAATIAAVSEAMAAVPRAVDVIWLFLDNRPEDVEPLIGADIPGTVLLGGGSFARDCGSGTATPVVLFINTDGTVNSFIRGYNQRLASDVISVILQLP